MNIKQVPTPDFTQGRGGKTLKYLIMHWSVTSTIGQVDSEVLNPSRQMSYHFCTDGNEVHQYCDTQNTAWHCGVFDKNQESIGVCIVAGPSNPYTDAKYEMAAQLIADIFRKHGRLELKGHRDFKATECPGNLDFGRLRARVDQILSGGQVMDKDAIQFEGNEKIYFWAQNPDVARAWYGDDWYKYVRVIKPQIIERQVPVEKIVEVIKEVEKIVEVEIPKEIIKEVIVQAELNSEQKTVLDIWEQIKLFFKKG